MQKKFEWHECISDEFKGDWDNILLQLENVRTIKIPKKVLNHNEGDVSQRVNLHGFNEASQQSYGSCIYLKFIFKGGKVSAHLNASKSRPAPVKETTIPRLALLDLSSLRPLVSGPQLYYTALGSWPPVPGPTFLEI